MRTLGLIEELTRPPAINWPADPSTTDKIPWPRAWPVSVVSLTAQGARYGSEATMLLSLPDRDGVDELTDDGRSQG